MYKLFLSLILVVFISCTNRKQSAVNSDSLTSDSIFFARDSGKHHDLQALIDALPVSGKNSYVLKFNQDFEPYLQINIENTSKNKKYSDYVIFITYYIGESGFKIFRKSHEVIDPNTKGVLRIPLDIKKDFGLKSPSELRVEKVEIRAIRLIDGSVRDTNFTIPKSKSLDD